MRIRVLDHGRYGIEIYYRAWNRTAKIYDSFCVVRGRSYYFTTTFWGSSCPKLFLFAFPVHFRYKNFESGVSFPGLFTPSPGHSFFTLYCTSQSVQIYNVKIFYQKNLMTNRQNHHLLRWNKKLKKKMFFFTNINMFFFVLSRMGTSSYSLLYYSK